MKTSVKGINLLPREYIIAEKIRLGQMIISGVVAFEIVCFVAFFAFPPKQKIVSTEQELLTKRNELISSRYEGVSKTLNDLKAAEADMKVWNGEYGKIKQKSYINGQLLDELVARVPQGVTISKLTVDSPTPAENGAVTRVLEINGHSKTSIEALNFVSVLETLFPSESIVHETNYDEKTKVSTFKITITLETAGTEVNVATTEGATSPETASTEGQEAAIQ